MNYGIGNVKAGGGGKQLYQHNIRLRYTINGTNWDINLYPITNDSNEEMNTKQKIISFLGEKTLGCYGFYRGASGLVYEIFAYSGDLYGKKDDQTGQNLTQTGYEPTSITDWVRTL